MIQRLPPWRARSVDCYRESSARMGAAWAANHKTQPNMKAVKKTGTDGGSPLGALPLAGAMAFLAGATDVYGLSRLRDVLVSFMSGNTTMLGQAINKGDIRRCGVILGIIGCFAAGAAVGTMLAPNGRDGGTRQRWAFLLPFCSRRVPSRQHGKLPSSCWRWER